MTTRLKCLPVLGRTPGPNDVKKNLETWKPGSIFNFREELFFFLHQGGGRLRGSGAASCPCPINTGPPGAAAGIQAASAEAAGEAGDAA